MIAYSLAISPCPNDTFIFHALLENCFKKDFSVVSTFADIEELNYYAARKEQDIIKVSVAGSTEFLEEYIILDSGAALGRGCGPLLVARKDCSIEQHKTSGMVAVPGFRTTAHLLLALHNTFTGERKEMVFDQIIPAVQQGITTFGVIIHEGRFVFNEYGLQCVLDFGQWWEKTFNLPLPLGLILARRSLGKERLLKIQNAIKQSIHYAYAHPTASVAFIKKHAQELDDAVIQQHIATFVTDFSLDLGQEGKAAVVNLLEKAAVLQNITLPAKPLFVSNL